MPNIGAPELIVILVIALLIIGPGKLPDVGSALGKSIREFRKATTDDTSTQAMTGAPPVAPLASPTVTPSAAIENKCPSCATVNPTGQVFCGQCGTRLTRAA